MKKVVLVLTILLMNTALFSCTNDSVADADNLYETQATEGDDEDVKPEPPKV